MIGAQVAPGTSRNQPGEHDVESVDGLRVFTRSSRCSTARKAVVAASILAVPSACDVSAAIPTDRASASSFLRPCPLDSTRTRAARRRPRATNRRHRSARAALSPGDADRPSRRRRPVQQRDQRTALPISPHHQLTPLPNLPQAGHHVTRPNSGATRKTVLGAVVVCRVGELGFEVGDATVLKRRLERAASNRLLRGPLSVEIADRESPVRSGIIVR
jgi:hypothetical protein